LCGDDDAAELDWTFDAVFRAALEQLASKAPTKARPITAEAVEWRAFMFEPACPIVRITISKGGNLHVLDNDFHRTSRFSPHGV
jgi:hypothetical protein